MTRKKEIKKRKRAQRKKNKQKKQSAQARFVKKVKGSAELPFSNFVVEPKGHAKMSEVILDFAEPLLDECDNEQTERIAIGLAILVWNVSLLPEKDQERELMEVCSTLPGSEDAKVFTMYMDHANSLLERKKNHFSENHRSILKYEISGSGKSRRLDVASTLRPDE